MPWDALLRPDIRGHHLQMTPDNPDALLARDPVAAALTAVGFSITGATLATKASRGGGPPYRLFNGRALYRWGDALAWAKATATPPRCSTSEADAPCTS